MPRQRDDARLNDEIEEHLALEPAENIRLLRFDPLFGWFPHDVLRQKFAPHAGIDLFLLPT